MYQVAIQAGLAILSAVFSRLTQKKPELVTPDTTSIYDNPPEHVATEDTFIPVIFGTVLLSAPNVVWYSHNARKNPGKPAIFEINMHSVFCSGPVDYVCELRLDGSMQRLHMVEEIFLLGLDMRDNGWIYTALGLKEQDLSRSSWQLHGGLASQVFDPGYVYKGDPLFTGVSYRGVCSVLFSDSRNVVDERGNNTIHPAIIRNQGSKLELPVVEAVINRAPKILNSDGEISPIDTTIGPVRLANPAEMIYECFTNVEWGLGKPVTTMNRGSFAYAAAVLKSENFGLGLALYEQGDIESFIQDILRYIDGVIYVDRDTNSISLQLLREGDISKASFNESNIREITSYVRPSYDDLPNSVRVVYSKMSYNDTDYDDLREDGVVVTKAIKTKKFVEPFYKFEKANVFAHNVAAYSSVLQKVDGGTHNFEGVYSERLALTLAQRELRRASTPLTAIEFTALPTPEAEALKPGDLIMIDMPYYTNSAAFRVTEITLGSPTDSSINIQAVSDFYAKEDATIRPVPPPTRIEPEPIATTFIWELPAWVRLQNNVEYEYDSGFDPPESLASNRNPVYSIYSFLRTEKDQIPGSFPYPDNRSYRGVSITTVDGSETIHHDIRGLGSIIRPDHDTIIEAYPANPAIIEDSINIKLAPDQINAGMVGGIFALVDGSSGHGSIDWDAVELLRLEGFNLTTNTGTFNRAWLGTVPKTFSLMLNNSFLIYLADKNYRIDTDFAPIKEQNLNVTSNPNGTIFTTHQTAVTTANRPSEARECTQRRWAMSARPEAVAGLHIVREYGMESFTVAKWNFREALMAPKKQSEADDPMNLVGGLAYRFRVEIFGEAAGFPNGKLLRTHANLSDTSYAYSEVQEMADNGLGRLSNFLSFKVSVTRGTGTNNRISAFNPERTIYRS